MAEKEKVYEYEKTYRNIVKSKSGKIYVYYKPRKIKVKKQLKEMVRVAVLFYLTTQSEKIYICRTSFFGKSATHKNIKNYLINFAERKGETSVYRYYRAGWTKMTMDNFDINYDQKFPQEICDLIETPEGSSTMDANEVLLNRIYDEFKENIKSFVTIHDYKNTILITREYRMPSERELKGPKKGIKTMARKAIVRFSEKQKIEQIKKEYEDIKRKYENLKKDYEKLKKQKR